tara:strand:+ start:284 stop:457 length:174 start_codon:yes stop_codon:yes gene_type:complete
MNGFIFSISMFWVSMFPSHHHITQADFFKPTIVGEQQDISKKAMFVKPVLRIMNLGM